MTVMTMIELGDRYSSTSSTSSRIRMETCSKLIQIIINLLFLHDVVIKMS